MSQCSKGSFLHLKISRGFYPFVVEWRLELIFDLSFQTFLYTMLHCLPALGLEGLDDFRSFHRIEYTYMNVPHLDQHEC